MTTDRSTADDDGAIDPERLARRDAVLLRLQSGPRSRPGTRAAAPAPVPQGSQGSGS